jgi:cobalamin biosynthesis Mg chelatase CobN
MKLVKKLFFILIVLLATLPTISFSQQLTISCNPCYVNNCQCSAKCNSGKMYVYMNDDCQDTASYIVTISNQKANFLSVQPGFFYARVDCTETGEISSCQPLYVASYSGQTATTTITTTRTQTTQIQNTQTQTASTQSTQSSQSSQTPITTTSTQNTRTTMQTGGQQSSSFNTILVLTLVIAVVVILAVFVIYWRSKASSENRYETLKQKWSS